MKNKKVLISGGGIAGLTLAFWLHKFGFEPTVIEVSKELRDEGYMIDFFGTGYDVAEHMGILQQLKNYDYGHITEMLFVDDNGKRVASLNIKQFRKLLNNRIFSFMRGDLERVLYGQVKKNVDIRFDTSIKSVVQLENGVDVTFTNGATESFDLLIGADGIHSNVRQLVLGDNKSYSRFLGYYTAAYILPNTLGKQDVFYSYVQPNAQASIYTIRDNKLATFFVYKSEDNGWIAPDKRKEELLWVYGNFGWIVPELLEKVNSTVPVYLDSLTQVRLPQWSKNRVALVGDACYCVTLMAGQGSSLAMGGAYILANELRKANGEFSIAFSQYEKVFKPFVEKIQDTAQGFTGSFVPRTQFGIWFRNKFAKIMFWPGIGFLIKKKLRLESFFTNKYPLK